MLKQQIFVMSCLVIWVCLVFIEKTKEGCLIIPMVLDLDFLQLRSGPMPLKQEELRISRGGARKIQREELSP